MRRLLVLACTGCGRIAFDEHASPPVDTPASNCIELGFDQVPSGFETLGNGSVTIDGRIRFAIDGTLDSEAILQTRTPASFVGRSVSIQAIAPSMTPGALSSLGWHAQTGDLTAVHLEMDGVNLKLSSYNPTLDQFIAYASMPYDPVEHAWWRLRHMEGNGSVFAEVSRDGIVWNAFGSASPAIDLTNMKWDLGMGSYAGTIPPSETTMDNSLDCPP